MDVASGQELLSEYSSKDTLRKLPPPRTKTVTVSKHDRSIR